MAKNYSGEGKTRPFVSPTGGTTNGVPVAINSLVVIPLEDTVKGQTFTGVLGGSWILPVTGALKTGAKVSWLASSSSLVAADTVDSVPFGKLLTDAVGGFADALLIQ
jgi:predicted RecA/RadA family phage recombinase